jgi:hypothetical protein
MSPQQGTRDLLQMKLTDGADESSVSDTEQRPGPDFPSPGRNFPPGVPSLASTSQSLTVIDIYCSFFRECVLTKIVTCLDRFHISRQSSGPNSFAYYGNGKCSQVNDVENRAAIGWLACRK